MSEMWQPPSAQQYPASESDGIRRLVGKMQEGAQRSREQTRSLLRTAGILLSEAGMRIQRNLTVEGDFESTGSTAIQGNTRIGGTLDVDATSVFDGDSTFQGSVVIEGDLAVPNGSIDNAALASPVTAAIGSGSGSGFGVGTGPALVAVGSIPVPAGYSQALVVATSGVTAVSASAEATQVYAATEIGGAGGAELWVLTDGAAYTATVTTAHARTLTGLNGGAISIGARVRSTRAWAGHPANSAVVSASALFFR